MGMGDIPIPDNDHQLDKCMKRLLKVREELNELSEVLDSGELGTYSDRISSLIVELNQFTMAYEGLAKDRVALLQRIHTAKKHNTQLMGELRQTNEWLSDKYGHDQAVNVVECLTYLLSKIAVAPWDNQEPKLIPLSRKDIRFISSILALFVMTHQSHSGLPTEIKAYCYARTLFDKLLSLIRPVTPLK